MRVTFEAVKEQLEILGHDVPDDVVHAFLADVNSKSGAVLTDVNSKSGAAHEREQAHQTGKPGPAYSFASPPSHQFPYSLSQDAREPDGTRQGQRVRAMWQQLLILTLRPKHQTVSAAPYAAQKIFRCDLCGRLCRLAHQETLATTMNTNTIAIPLQPPSPPQQSSPQHLVTLTPLDRISLSSAITLKPS
jgi:hypothetical protein